MAQKPKQQQQQGIVPRSILNPLNFPNFFPNLARFPNIFESFPSEIENLFLEQSKRLNVSTDDKNVYVEADVPGVNKENINLTLDRGELRIQAEKEEEEEDKNKTFYQKSSASYSYRVALPALVDETSIKATYKDGVLKITLPKAKQEQAKKIPIKQG